MLDQQDKQALIAPRVHMGIEVRDLAASIGFYTKLWGAAPTKVKPGYAKFELEEPAVHLALNENPHRAPLAVGAEHWGIQVRTPGEVEQMAQRLKERGLDGEAEHAVACCYSVQEKMWFTDPDGRRWEVFAVLEANSEERSASDCCATPGDAAADCCDDAAARVKSGSSCCG